MPTGPLFQPRMPDDPGPEPQPPKETIMQNISKAIGAAVGGTAAGTVAVPFMPEGTPWYGYLALYVITIGLPALLTYFAPANKS